MDISESEYLKILKEQIVKVMQQSYPGIPDSISNWKGQNIIDFQSDLRFKQKENISEKWFYIHMKSSNSKLPRIDILNFLSKYVGYKNWEEFKLKTGNDTFEIQPDNSNRVFYLVPLIMLVAVAVFYLIFKSMYTQEYTFCFYDNDTKEPIVNSIIEIGVLSDNESPVNYLCNKDGCFTIKTNKRILKFVVETPCYHPDTIVRTLNKFNRTENVKLKIDDYAIMIQYFSNSNVNDWLKRRENLNDMFSDSAKIFQVLEGTVGMEMYNKWEFINKLTLPANSLRDIEILDTKYGDEKITHLRFIQNGLE
ncbi:MAG: hypothetical protein HN778_01055 [Prolixibacteraceae bacterium]|jgi:hypothetical protein|nr:hypothetical protein [Prolixibacteraceae bacterium]MBT6004507.1 hypothetical protein [Prolixibacteraceae bacterium]MBT6765390.1 hypothetical protein [Prolixibacteraceae bacterium]MBT6998737.1 hypothetical protein [Prolixibacteraceae bacterium]MBT7393397.1 hypothetical protein [Prolixibacteraceae bacterium]